MRLIVLSSPDIYVRLPLARRLARPGGTTCGPVCAPGFGAAIRSDYQNSQISQRPSSSR